MSTITTMGTPVTSAGMRRDTGMIMGMHMPRTAMVPDMGMITGTMDMGMGMGMGMGMATSMR
jgi:hypothetical protein